MLWTLSVMMVRCGLAGKVHSSGSTGPSVGWPVLACRAAGWFSELVQVVTVEADAPGAMR